MKNEQGKKAFNKTEVIKHSAAIQIKNKINLLQRRTWNVLLANAFSELMTKKRHEITVQDLQKVLNFKSNNQEHLKEAIEGLVGCVVSWNILGKDNKNIWKATGLLADAEIENGICTYSYSEILKEKLFNPTMYTRINLSLQNKFTSKYSLALYELCLDYLNWKTCVGETPEITIEVYRDLMGLSDNQYPLFKDLNKFVLKSSVNEVNHYTDLKITVKHYRKMRKIVSLKFLINKKNQLVLFSQKLKGKAKTEQEVETVFTLPKDPEEDKNLEVLVALLKRKTDSLKNEIVSAVQENGFDYVRSNILYSNDKSSKNYSYFLKQSLKKDWGRELREEMVFNAWESQKKDLDDLLTYLENLSVKQEATGLNERFEKLPDSQQKKFLESARGKILRSRHGEVFKKDEKLFKKAIQGEAIKIWGEGG